MLREAKNQLQCIWLFDTLVFEENDTKSLKILNENHTKYPFKVLKVLPLTITFKVIYKKGQN